MNYRATLTPTLGSRRTLISRAIALLAAAACTAANAAGKAHPSRTWFDEAQRMKDLALSWGDQAFGAVVVADGQVLGYGPSRVVKDKDPDAHAERVAIREAQLMHSAGKVLGAVLYATSRPCIACERAAAAAGIRRMYFGEAMHDAGTPTLH